MTRASDAASPAEVHRTVVPVFEVCGADRLLAPLAVRGFRVTPQRPRRMLRCEDPLGQSICVVDVGAQTEPVLPAAHR